VIEGLRSLKRALSQAERALDEWEARRKVVNCFKSLSLLSPQ
jgi:hypothetical protein